MSKTPKPGSGDDAFDNAPSGTATGKSRIAPVPVSPTLNGPAGPITVEPRMTPIDALREKLALTGTKGHAIAESVAHAPCTLMVGAFCC
jgi:hypothetical protein